ncbi:MAG TPA: LuxR C-terminal-related transcriptional regulator [Cyclobacteriaceae bacterium]|nr:LuxR C-terminal-related transcriptional regulator [Cyclobacteriaceae bacterium]HRJ83951.1 LuxR C-terminal-related transcriptional regulator [Cyclobacteriaceae bacterium]
MTRTIFIYGLVLAVAVFMLKMLEYKFFYRQLSVEIYIGIIGVLFTILGIWVGNKITRKKKVFIAPPVGEFKVNERILGEIGISKREYEVLELMAKGLSNQEIADKLFVSLNTVKTHTANLFLKLEVKRRTQAIQRAKELRLLQ